MVQVPERPIERIAAPSAVVAPPTRIASAAARLPGADVRRPGAALLGPGRAPSTTTRACTPSTRGACIDGQGYVHDPMMHGPLLFELNALIYLLFGASDFTARLVPALLGVGVIGLPFLLRHELGRTAPSPPRSCSRSRPRSCTSRASSATTSTSTSSRCCWSSACSAIWRTAPASAGSTPPASSAALLFATKEDFFISGFIPFVLPGRLLVPAARASSRQLFRGRVRAHRLARLGDRRSASSSAINLAAVHDVLHQPAAASATAVVTLPLARCAGSTGAL